ncbi:primosomal protein N' [Pseudactinotalea sp. Z1732]|uniref:primosomal protein N' n=1 Tax=Pseudactinotalea sp. Z1732 TaxID=3413026 RepID=UPI003C7A8E44
MSTHQPALLQVDAPGPESDTGPGLVAQVLVVTPLAHLDRPFDYAVPPEMSAAVRPGVRVKVRFAGTERDGFVISLGPPATAGRALSPLRRVVSDLPVLTEEVLALCRAVARRYAGTVTDVLRLAVPPRHAGAEKAALQRILAASGQGQSDADDDAPAQQATSGGDGVGPGSTREVRWAKVTAVADEQAWSPYPGGSAFLRRLAAGESPRAVWSALPRAIQGAHWAEAISHAVLATCTSGRSAVVVLPDTTDVHTLGAALTRAGVAHEVLAADQGRSARYRRFVLALTGQVQVVIGTRSAAFAPVPDLGLVVCWDDGDDSLAEMRAPYPHARTVLVQRATGAGAGALIGGYVRTPAAQLLVQQGWARSLHADRTTVRAAAPRVQAPGEVELEAEGPAGRARIPGVAWRLLRSGLQSGPVLVQVPRRGYVPAISCAGCRTPARCRACHGRLRLPARGATPGCGWCGRIATGWRCAECGRAELRSARVGSDRTAEELGRAFPGVPVLVSGRDGGVVPGVDDRPRLVVATPGAEPVAEGGYYAAALLDAAVTTERPELDAGVEALRRWLRAAALVRSAADGGGVILLGHGAPVPSQALVRWDPIGLAQRELDERAELGFPPQAHMAALSGPASAVRSFLRALQLPPGAEVLGPVDLPGDPHAEGPGSGPQGEETMVRALVRGPLGQREPINIALLHTQAHRSARKEPGTVRVQVDPVQLW